MAPYIFIIDGNISSGKSTLIDALAADGYTCFPEAVSSWTDILEDMYNKTHRADALQIRIALDQGRIAQNIESLAQRNAAGRPKGNVVFIERWIDSARNVFIKAAKESEHITITPEGVRMWEDLVQLLKLDQLKIDGYIYVKSTPDITFDRVKIRSEVRQSERAIDKSYLAQLHCLYEAYISQIECSDGGSPKLITLTNDATTPEAFAAAALKTIKSSLDD